MSWITTVAPLSTRRMRAREPYGLLPELCEPSIDVDVTPAPRSANDFVAMMSLPCVSEYVFVPSTIVSPPAGVPFSALIASRSEQSVSVPRQSPVPATVGSSVLVTVIVAACAAAAPTSRISIVISGASKPRLIRPRIKSFPHVGRDESFHMNDGSRAGLPHVSAHYLCALAR